MAENRVGPDKDSERTPGARVNAPVSKEPPAKSMARLSTVTTALEGARPGPRTASTRSPGAEASIALWRSGKSSGTLRTAIVSSSAART
jgi:hypothetical protein